VPVFLAPHRRRGRPKGSSGLQLRKIERIQFHTARACQVRIENLRSKKRIPRFVNARQIAMFVSRKVTDVSYPELGKAFERDHTTVLYSVREVQKRIDAGDAKTIRALSTIHAKLAR
jgi:chromosomal replication initiation ATPase DnaA